LADLPQAENPAQSEKVSPWQAISAVTLIAMRIGVSFIRHAAIPAGMAVYFHCQAV